MASVEKEEEQEEVTESQIESAEKYASKNFIDPPKLSKVSTLNIDCLTLQHSFGYECKKRANLHVLDNCT
eukprot:14299.XXX_1036839_1036573_1 [CDS] Oithona nana genome sequencing.